MEALELLATQPLLTKLLNRGPDPYELRLVGNILLLITGLVLALILAAFGEESVYRGYLTNRVADVFGRSTTAWVALIADDQRDVLEVAKISSVLRFIEHVHVHESRRKIKIGPLLALGQELTTGVCLAYWTSM